MSEAEERTDDREIGGGGEPAGREVADELEPRTSPPPPRPGEPEITAELVEEHGLSREEFERVVHVLGRVPTFTELGVFSAMWSEHCGYKNSRRLLQLLPTEAPWVIQGPGENAGVIDLGGEWALAFKIESHNHPSAVEPYQGAATGVGGILRDVFTMGARPIATLDSLRFGDLDDPRTRWLFGGVVRGIGDYGNCVGIPNLGGEVYFDRGYRGNPLVNAMCLGLMRKEELITAEAEGVGNTLMAVGARTGRDGIHGATFASEELSEDADEASRPQVQVGDPFTEKLLLEASLELIRSGHIVGIQDMGAAGLTSSASEMAGRAGTGVEIDVAKVPVREPGMTPYEILLSESQERMLVVAKEGREDEVREILEKWELEAAEIGRVTGDGIFRVLEDGTPVAEIPALPLTDGCPTYEREGIESEEIARLRARDLSDLDDQEGDRTGDFLTLLGSPTIASKRWVYQQYDTTVRASSVLRPGGDAGVVRIADTERGVAATTDVNGRYVYLHPRRGAKIAVAEAARNLVCVGAVPTAVTNCLNFGSPLRPHIYYQFREAVQGMAEACRLFETPVTGGNVSFYNETDGRAVYPTPVIGMVGIVEDLDHVTPHHFREEGDAIVLLGECRNELGGSELLYRLRGEVAGAPPSVDLLGERRLQHAVLAMNQQGLLRSAHDCSEGGLACALAEAAVGDGEDPRGVEVEVGGSVPLMGLLFGESQGRVVVSCAGDTVDEVRELAKRHGVPCRRIGTVGGVDDAFRIRADRGGVDVDLQTVLRVYFDAIPDLMDRGYGSGAAEAAD
ncbi:MAG: phosphoribosylformylglycinamidine synthase subunit PurL [Gemmatimonadetes bacterium]|nr:phosphoribosylformylglycinamidine synthase subunit PurL [Gemmatimonadota bacterium]NIR77083.1 phosphoribosylformylglycinamidine synthase subunit PurL [Gemmatimonadota bacterium]NIT85603.1 phosphoribosylformylglycinamidine synthase subunit PurL [Gemmatimonadota bacterium]NIU29435.1 phosphoribosylformylglycinamidine synthase subunit PurL [Gemmatimonadota bacterium]NIU34507.1 phosphoribosylformylglycinamidine synthase subunit PurL [Gemmatimonadota bacterium]